MNRVILVGNLGKSPELRKLGDGTEVARLALATTEVFRKKDGTLSSQTQWHIVILWRGLAGMAEKYLRKGSLVLLEGSIRYRRYEDGDGVSRRVMEVVGDRMLMLDKKVAGGVGGQEVDKAEILPDDDLPF